MINVVSLLLLLVSMQQPVSAASAQPPSEPGISGYVLHGTVRQ